jgi:serine/threonine protein kinase
MDALRQAQPFGKYVLLERVSVGGMAEVFKAKAFGVEGFEKILAIKRILPSMAEDADFIEMFIDEAKICGQLNHANICQIFELGRVSDSHFIAMEYVWGKDVLQMQNRFRKLRQKMKPEMAAYIVCKICEGLDYAHKKKDAQGRPLGIIHRDISPQNILVSYEGELKVIDFGIAKAASRSSKTQAGVLKGKFGYMSPEQVRGLPLDRRSDLFAIGTILYELLTAERLFYGESDFETLEKVRNVDVLPPTQANPSIPKTLERIIMRALSKDVEGRYQWASEMAEDLNAFLLSHDPVFSPQSLSQWMREQFAVEMRRERLVLDEQQKVTRESAAQGASTRPTQRSIPHAAAAAPVIEEDDDFNEKTTVSLPGFGDAPAPPSHANLPEQSTRILDGGMPGPASTGSSVPELSAQSTVVFSETSGPQRPQSAKPPSLPGMAHANGSLIDQQPIGVSIDASLYPNTGERLGVVPHTPHYGQLMPQPIGLPPLPQRSTVWKDIIIGIAVAAAVVLGVLGVRGVLARRGEATLVVMSPTIPGDVIIDGTPRGPLSSGQPMTLKAFPTGEHSVVVRSESGDFQQSVTLAAGDVSVVTAQFQSAKGDTGKLKLSIDAPAGAGPAEPTTADVYVDGAQLSPEASRNAISLRAGAPHEVRISKVGYEEQKLEIELKPGDTQTRVIHLVASVGKLTVTSDPPGADLIVNGHREGSTPATVANIEMGKPARVSLKLAGYQSVTKSVSMEPGSPQALDVKLVAGKDKEETADLAPSKTPHKDTPPDKVVPDKTVEKPDKTKPVVAKTPSKDATKPDKTAFPSDGLAAVSFNNDKGAAASSEPGYLVANTQPWAKVIIDGKDTGKTTPIAPRSKIPLKAGKHTVTFVASGKKYNFDIVVKPGEEIRLIKQLSDAP